MGISTMIFSPYKAVMTALMAIGVYTYISMNTPIGVQFSSLPENSPLHHLPPWHIFRPAVALQDWFARSSQATTPPPVQILDLATAYWKSEVTYALTKNGIIDTVGAKDTGMTCREVALELQLNEHPVCEYMRAGFHLGLLTKVEEAETQEDRYILSPSGALLQSNVPGSLRDFTLMVNEETRHAWRAAGTKSIQPGGKSGFYEHYGKEFWPWHNDHPELEAQFDRAMQSLGFANAGALLGEWQPKPKSNNVVCDIGGGIGTTAKFVLEHYPEMSAIVLDQPEVATRASTFLEEAGLSKRTKALGGDFFQPLPDDLKQCDTFFMKFILHDWGDEESIAILKNLKAVAKAGSEIVLVEHVLDTGAVAGMELTKHLMSINMLASNQAGARERNLAAYQSLFDRAGLGENHGYNKAELVPTRSVVSLVKLQL